MFKPLQDKKAQSITEYTMIVVVILAAITAMSVLSKRALMGKLLDTHNYMVRTVEDARVSIAGTEPASTLSPQYEPYYSYVDSTVTQNSQQSVQMTGRRGPNPASYQRYYNDRSFRQMYREELPYMGVGTTSPSAGGGSIGVGTS